MTEFPLLPLAAFSTTKNRGEVSHQAGVESLRASPCPVDDRGSREKTCALLRITASEPKF